MQPTPSSDSSPVNAPAVLPWWRYGHVWLVVAGPAVVVVASIVTLVLALRLPDPVLAGDAYRQGAQVGASRSAGDAGARAWMPALQGRNHAVSPAPPREHATPAVPSTSGAPGEAGAHEGR
jgi:hypothetical protein